VYAFLASVLATDTKQLLQSLAASLAGYVVADPSGSGYLLAYQGAAIQAGTDPKTGTPMYTPAMAFVGYNQDVPTNVIGALSAAGPYCREIAYNPARTRADIDADLLRHAGYAGASNAWAIHPGDDLAAASAADLLSRFVPLA
jgi:hypothetical protein